MIKIEKRAPKEVKEVAEKINQWMEDQEEIPYNCDPWLTENKSKLDGTSEWVIASNYEDGFSCLGFSNGVWYERDWEGFDERLKTKNPEWIIIGIMSM